MNKYLTLNKSISTIDKLSKQHLHKYSNTGDSFEFIKHEITWTLHSNLVTERENITKPIDDTYKYLINSANHIINFKEATPPKFNTKIIKNYEDLLATRIWLNYLTLQEIKDSEQHIHDAIYLTVMINMYDVLIDEHNPTTLLKDSNDEITNIANKNKLLNMFNIVRFDPLHITNI